MELSNDKKKKRKIEYILIDKDLTLKIVYNDHTIDMFEVLYFACKAREGSYIKIPLRQEE